MTLGQLFDLYQSGGEVAAAVVRELEANAVPPGRVLLVIPTIHRRIEAGHSDPAMIAGEVLDAIRRAPAPSA